MLDMFSSSKDTGEEIDKNKEETKSFSEELSGIADDGYRIGAAFMNVDENIGMAIQSAAGLFDGVSQISAAFEGEEFDLGSLGAGLSGVFSTLGNQFGGEGNDDFGQLMSGLSGMSQGLMSIAASDAPERASGKFSPVAITTYEDELQPS